MRKSKKRIRNSKNGISILLIILISFIPILVTSKYITYNQSVIDTFTLYGEGYVDFFSYGKMIFIVLIAFFMIVSFVITNYKKKLEIISTDYIYYVPMVIFVFGAILSTLFASNKFVAIVGYYGRFEGLLVIASYMIFLFYSIYYIKEEKQIITISKYIIFSIFIVSLLGACQYFGFDYFKSDTGLFLIGALDKIEISREFGSNTSYSTLYNPNYVGLYSALVFPFVLAFIFAIKSIRYKVFAFVTLILIVISLVGSRSEGGYLGVIFSIIFFIIFFTKTIIKKSKILYIVLVAGFIALGISGFIINNNKNYIDFEKTLALPDKSDLYIENITLDNEQFIIETNEGTLIFEDVNGEIIYKDGNNNLLTLEGTRFEQSMYNERYVVKYINDYTINLYFRFNKKYNYIQFYHTKEKGFIAVAGIGNTITSEIIPNQMPELFRSYEKSFSSRGYMWFTTLSKLDEHIIAGVGPDNYAIGFPQFDFIGKLNMGINPIDLIDKPHNLFLQYAFQLGVLALLAFLFICFYYLITSIKMYISKNVKSTIEILGAAIPCSVIGFMIAGVFADSNVSVTPLFYLLLGVGIAINKYVKGRKK